MPWGEAEEDSRRAGVPTCQDGSLEAGTGPRCTGWACAAPNKSVVGGGLQGPQPSPTWDSRPLPALGEGPPHTEEGNQLSDSLVAGRAALHREAGRRETQEAWRPAQREGEKYLGEQEAAQSEADSGWPSSPQM